jgi:hypothetical protein
VTETVLFGGASGAASVDDTTRSIVEASGSGRSGSIDHVIVFKRLVRHRPGRCVSESLEVHSLRVCQCRK